MANQKINPYAYYQVAQAADANLKRLAAEILVLLDKKTQEGVQQALAMRPALTEAEGQTSQAWSTYRDWCHIDSYGTVAPGRTTINRAEFDRCSPNGKSAFLQSGGRIVD
jgi:hypothetical protein